MKMEEMKKETKSLAGRNLKRSDLKEVGAELVYFIGYQILGTGSKTLLNFLFLGRD
jgi:hypothetical protein